MKKSSRRKIRVLVTGGPTRAYLDRVRFLSNISSGAVALELGRALCRRGIEVELVSGPCSQPFSTLPLHRWYSVETTEEMHAAVMRSCRTFRPDFAVFSAAVLDFAPSKVIAGKVSSAELSWQITLKPTPKIIDEVGRRHPKIQRIGFKLEWKKPRTEKALRALAQQTIEQKNLAALCLNFLSEISGEQHPAFLLGENGKHSQVKSKAQIATWIASYISDRSGD